MMEIIWLLSRPVWHFRDTIGVVSTNPGVTLNSDAATDSTHPYLYPIALAGRIPVKVSTESGAILVGDHLTPSELSPVML